MYYKRSGKLDPVKTILLLLVMLVLTAVVSFAYAYLCHYIPFIYINILCTAGVGGALFFMMHTWTKQAHIRNLPVQFVGLVLMFAVFVYAHFLGYAVVNLGEGFLDTEVLVLLLQNPGASSDLEYMNFLGFLGWIQELNAAGTWGISENSAAAVSGLFLTGIWAVEHCIVFGVGCVGLVLNAPYIEAEGLQGWGVEKTLAVFPELPKDIKKQLERRDYTAFAQPASGPRAGHTCLLTYFTDSDERSGEYYLSLNEKTVTADKKGKTKENSKELVRFLSISPSDLSRLRQTIEDARAAARPAEPTEPEEPGAPAEPAEPAAVSAEEETV
jgi:hypothetical protein